MESTHQAARGIPAAAAHGGRMRNARAGGRLVVLDGLRILAALMVVFHHYVGYGGAADGAGNAWSRPIAHVFPLASKFGAYMWTGVSLFFLISGFVIGMSTWGRGLGDFFTSRVVRLYPAYWFGVLATTAVLTVWPMVAQPLHAHEVLANLTMLQGAMHITNVDASYWTLWYELCFYLLFCLVVRQGLTYRRVVAFCMLWTVAGLGSVAMEWGPLQVIAMPWISSFFVAGLAFYLMYRFRPTLLLWTIIGVSLALSLIYARDHQHAIDAALGGRHLPVWPAYAMILLCYAVMAAVSFGLLSRIRWRWLTVAGSLTYPLYLLHEAIGWTAIRLLHDRIPKWPLVALVTVGMLVAAYLVHRIVERPLSRLLKRGISSGLAELRAGGTPAPVGPTAEGGFRPGPPAPTEAPAQRQPTVRV
ncbi:acyltransferase family protein [Streptomyces virginiae]|uniref:acyltransferase family protein n=1 Tax=Streptomyces virginiae TaxID=1961 RepID=UPI0035E130A1